MRNRLQLASVAIAMVLACLASSAHAQNPPAPDATVEFSGGSVAAGIGWTWGSGTLTYKGIKHPFSVSGLSVGLSAGAASMTASGSVYNLKRIEDFNGNYTA